jgi:hypothetical protein
MEWRDLEFACWVPHISRLFEMWVSDVTGDQWLDSSCKTPTLFAKSSKRNKGTRTYKINFENDISRGRAGRAPQRTVAALGRSAERPGHLPCRRIASQQH